MAKNKHKRDLTKIMAKREQQSWLASSSMPFIGKKAFSMCEALARTTYFGMGVITRLRVSCPRSQRGCRVYAVAMPASYADVQFV